MADVKVKDRAREFELKLKDVRLSFAHIFRPQPGVMQDDGTLGPPKYNCSFLIDKNTPEGKVQAKAVSDMIKAAGNAKWGEGKWNLKPEKKCLRDGDLETYDGYAGMYFVAASNTRKPVVKDRKNQPVSEQSGLVYSGCYVNAIIRVWVQDNDPKKGGKRINASLEGIQFVRKGDAFGAAPLSDDAFDELEGDEEDNEVAGEEDDLGI